MSATYTLNNRSYTSKTCPVCGIEYYVPSAFEDEQRRLGAKGGWHCPNGHARVYRRSEAETLRQERDRLIQGLAEKDDDLRHQRERAEGAERRVSAARGQITKLKKRAANGVCPCCNRSFTDLQRHMHSQHPGFVAEPDASEHVH